MNLETKIKEISRITPAFEKRLLILKIRTIKDLFYHFPHRYDDFSKITPIGDLKLGETTTVQGKIIEIKNIRLWRRKMVLTEAFIEDQTGLIKAVWFNQPFLLNSLKEGMSVSLSGKISFDKTLFLSNPAYERFDEKEALRHTGRLVPVYPETFGLTSRYLRYLIRLIFPYIQISDWLPEKIKKSQKLIGLDQALREIHFPSSKKLLEAARRRLAFDELFLIQIFLIRQKMKWRQNPSPQIPFDQPLIKNFVSRLPFELTGAQRRAAWEILQDLEKTKPMNRLLEGDVGSGKTVVAAIASLQVSENGWQTAFMAPTEILARQHFETLKKFFDRQSLKIALLTGQSGETNNGKSSKKEILEEIKNGEIRLIIGTHALIQKKVRFKNLALAIVDEQHRFGVEQRAALQKNIFAIKDGRPKTIPHLLSMTATPIPRTLALAFYGDLDLSLLDESPKNRKKIITKIVPLDKRQEAYDFVRQQIKTGRQVFVICPRIEASQEPKERKDEASETFNPTNKNTEARGMALNEGRRSDRRSRAGLAWEAESERPASRQNKNLSNKYSQAWAEVKAVKEEFEKLSKDIFPDLRVSMLHGRLAAEEKQKIMKDLLSRRIDILVSTSVIEIGVDVPNASLILIEDAERFGLAQLHQFRGRVGRSDHQSFCLLFSSSSSAATRLNALINCQNGFELAEKDLSLRGPGEFIGTRQSGLPDLSMASLTDVFLIKEAKKEAQKVLDLDPLLQKNFLLKNKLSNFQNEIHLE